MGRVARNEFYKTKVTEKRQNKSDKAKRERKNPDSCISCAQTPVFTGFFKIYEKNIEKKIFLIYKRITAGKKKKTERE